MLITNFNMASVKLMGLHETATIDVEQCNVLMMLPTLHCPQGGLIIYVGEGLIEKDPPY